MQNKTIYITIMTHGSSEFSKMSIREQRKRKSKMRPIEETYQTVDTYKPIKTIIPEDIEYIQYITYLPLGCYTHSTRDGRGKNNSLKNFEKHIDKIKTLHGEKLRNELLELGDEVTIHPTKNIKRDISIQKTRFNKSNGKEREMNLMVLQSMLLTNRFLREDNLYSYIEYKKDEKESTIIKKEYYSDKDFEDIYVLAQEGGSLIPYTRILSDIQRHALDLEYTDGEIDDEEYEERIKSGDVPSSVYMNEILSYLQNEGYKRIIIIDYSCNNSSVMTEGKEVKAPRDKVIHARKEHFQTKSSSSKSRVSKKRRTGGYKNKRTRKYKSL
jgi:hypothetical protein